MFSFLIPASIKNNSFTRHKSTWNLPFFLSHMAGNSIQDVLFMVYSGIRYVPLWYSRCPTCGLYYICKVRTFRIVRVEGGASISNHKSCMYSNKHVLRWREKRMCPDWRLRLTVKRPEGPFRWFAEFIAKVVTGLLSSRDTPFLTKNLHPCG